MQPLFFDEFNIDEQIQTLKKLIASIEIDVYKFISPTKNKAAAIRARQSLRDVKKISSELRKSIGKQRQHNDSEY